MPLTTPPIDVPLGRRRAGVLHVMHWNLSLESALLLPALLVVEVVEAVMLLLLQLTDEFGAEVGDVVVENMVMTVLVVLGQLC